MATPAELLVKVETAIAAILDGGAVQSYSIGGRNLSRMPLEDLQDMRADLLREVRENTDSHDVKIQSIKFGGTP
jgi:hypothetical protein